MRTSVIGIAEKQVENQRCKMIDHRIRTQNIEDSYLIKRIREILKSTRDDVTGEFGSHVRKAYIKNFEVIYTKNNREVMMRQADSAIINIEIEIKEDMKS